MDSFMESYGPDAMKERFSPQNILGSIGTWRSNFQNQVQYTVKKMTIHDYLRLVIIVGAYCLLRPYLIKLGARFQAKDHERELDPDEMSSAAAVSPNSLRGQVQLQESDDEDDEVALGTGADWGKKARRRQRQMIKNILAAEEKRLAEEAEADSDKDIEEFLVKD
ncbi:MAG: hypothetical protein M1819_004464 [Sarea resinae]|nr:MAG: hypothetical protein M1819_004464 [Sarea resinae]